jgi:hypothetical protein
VTGRALVTAAILAFAVTPALAQADPSAGPCDPARRAVAHRADGTPEAAQLDNRPVPCLSIVGRTSESASVGVGRTGSLFFAPLIENTSRPPQNTLEGPESVMRSRDGGTSWTKLSSGGPTTGGFVPPWMSVDPQTSRVWFVTTLPTLCGARISWSDDDGESWKTNPVVGCPAQGANKLIEGPAPKGGAQPTGYPHVVYFCANGQDTVSSSVSCYRSLDGGQSFDAVGSPDPARPDGCDEQHPARAGVVGRDGVLYFPTSMCGVLGIAISRDEGASWQWRTIAATEVKDTYIATLAADAAGTLYIAWIGAGDLPMLTVSRDAGESWSPPTRVVAPGVRQVRRVAITAGRRGQIALAYQGTTDGVWFHGYITTTTDVLAPHPLFFSATVDAPASPLVRGSDAQEFGDRLLYQTTVLTSDGTVLAGFHCAKTPRCPSGRTGVFGRLLPPSNDFRLRPLGDRRRIAISVPGRGTLEARGVHLRVSRRSATRAGTYNLSIRPTRLGRGTLRRHHRLRTAVRVTYTPLGGQARTRRSSITLRTRK